MSFKEIAALVLFSVLGVACAMPVNSTKSINESPGLLVTGASVNAELLVDGLEMGAARQYSGKSEKSCHYGPKSPKPRKNTVAATGKCSTSLKYQSSGNALAVLPGRHVVEVREKGITVHREEIFVSAGSIQTIHIPGRPELKR